MRLLQEKPTLSAYLHTRDFISARVFISLPVNLLIYFRDFTRAFGRFTKCIFLELYSYVDGGIAPRLPVIDFDFWFIDFDLYYLFIHLVTWFSLIVISAPDVAADVEAVTLHLLFTHPLTPVIDILDVLTPYSQIKLLGSLGNCVTCEVRLFAEPHMCGKC